MGLSGMCAAQTSNQATAVFKIGLTGQVAGVTIWTPEEIANRQRILGELALMTTLMKKPQLGRPSCSAGSRLRQRRSGPTFRPCVRASCDALAGLRRGQVRALVSFGSAFFGSEALA